MNYLVSYVHGGLYALELFDNKSEADAFVVCMIKLGSRNVSIRSQMPVTFLGAMEKYTNNTAANSVALAYLDSMEGKKE